MVEFFFGMQINGIPLEKAIVKPRLFGHGLKKTCDLNRI
jgi:hypothetical protein